MDSKRQRVAASRQLGQASCKAAAPELLSLPMKVLQMVLNHLDSRSLARMRAVCRLFVGGPGQESMTEEAAKAVMLRLHNGNARLAERLGGCTWLMRLRMEGVHSPIDTESAWESGFRFIPTSQDQLRVSLTVPGPKLLFSQQTTHDTDILRWHLEVRSNTALELGVIPADMQVLPKALQRCRANTDGDCATGICSSISMRCELPITAPLMIGSKVELVLQRDVLKIFIDQPKQGLEPVIVKGKVETIPYTGPPQMRFEFDYQYQGPARLAITCYQGAELLMPASQVLHLGEGLPA